MSTLNFINSSALRGDASLISNSKLLLQSSGNTTATQSFIFNDGASSKLALGIGDPATASNIKFFIDSAGDINISSNVGIGTAPQTADDLAVKGNIHAISGLRDGSSNLGSNNYVLTSTGSATAWADASSSSIIGGPYVEIAGDTMTGPLIIEDALSNPNPLLTLYNTTSGDYSTIEFSDQAPTVLQKGYLKFSHLDSKSFGGGASFHFNSTEDDLVLAVGDADATHGRVAVWSGGSSAEADYCFAQDVNTGMRRLGTDNVGLIGGGVTGVSVTGTATSLRYAGGTKLATTSTGVNITGTTTGSSTATFSGGTATGATVLTIGSSSQTSFTKQDWINDTHGSSQAYILAYGSTNAQAGNFAMKNLETGGEIFFELASSSEPLRLTSTHITLGSYGSGSVTGTVANLLAVDSSGKVIETTASGSGAVTGSGTAEYIPKWNSTTALVNSRMFQSTVNSTTFLNVGNSSNRMGLLVTPTQTSTITGYDFGLELNNDSTFNVGAKNKTYTSIYEGIKILPATSHYLTRITPRLEVYPFEDPSTTTDNTYDSNFTGSSFSMGSSNTIGSSGSSNLAIFGFNNKIKGDKFVIIGQGNEMDLDANTSSLAVGTTNDVLSGGLVNSLLVGQNINVNAKVTRGIISGINHSFTQDSNNCLVTGSGNAVYGNNNFIWGASHQGLSGVNNIMQGGFSTQVTNGSGNLYGSVLVGWNNTLSYASKASLITGRDNVVAKTDYSIVGGFNNDVGHGGTTYSGNLVVGTNNQINVSHNIVGGSGNSASGSGSRNVISGANNTVTSGDNLVVGSSNTVRIDECVVGGNSNTIGDTFDTSDARILAMGQSNSASNTSNTLLLGAGNTTGNNIGAPTNVTNAATFGQNNTLATAGNAPDNNFLLFSMGRSNYTSGTLAFAFGGGNTVRSNTNGNCIAIGNTNTIGWTTTSGAARNTIVIGTQNSIQNSVQNNRNDYKILIGRGLDEVGTAGADYVLIGRNNDQNNDYSVLNMSCSLIVGASVMGSANDRRNAIVVQNKTGSSDEPNVILPSVGKYRNYANDSAAATGGVPLYGIYHTNGDLKIRVT
jgi:hypothetical protein